METYHIVVYVGESFLIVVLNEDTHGSCVGYSGVDWSITARIIDLGGCKGEV